MRKLTARSPPTPYGASKLAIEGMLKWCSRAYGIQYAALRYFNAAGANTQVGIGEDHHPESHLIPIVLQCALGKRDHVGIFGDDYPTPDGTCIRDYIHVRDLVSAHLLALEYLDRGGESGPFNLGNGTGFSVKEIIETARKVTGKPIPAVVEPRRAGDPSVLIASNKKALSSWAGSRSGIWSRSSPTPGPGTAPTRRGTATDKIISAGRGDALEAHPLFSAGLLGKSV